MEQNQHDAGAAGSSEGPASAGEQKDAVTGPDPTGPDSAASASAPTVADVMAAVEELWPQGLAEPWDAVGLVAGRPGTRVEKILFAVDPTTAVLDEAFAWGASMILSHHPLLLKPVSGVAASGFKGEVIHRLIEGGCALATVHTNGDSAVGGVSDVLAEALGLHDLEPLMRADGGSPAEGIGRVGELGTPQALGDFAEAVFSILPAVAGGVRVAGDRKALIRRVAVCGGAGDSLFDQVRSSGADVFVTADLRHHPASEAREAAGPGTPYLIDVSHFGSEWLWLTPAAARLGALLSDRGFGVDIRVSEVNTDPWDFVLTPGR
ncbi:Nif3-like dinuclear metal center hexameric protein [Arthrobacter echini]|uniref:GTP cyclohydrolase 1 type 2 homolog n=1 Tax=Arthrobacter echini TaxID=1529066 RepID=A0A4S5E697_9MICC|nr:Nif3-like dinuclear metal center hexameric protein [Arthrobacter echini]THJ66980.1 Nif3-like dinuclear metal center hexameric protein [Arthrobacter echini]